MDDGEFSLTETVIGFVTNQQNEPKNNEEQIALLIEEVNKIKFDLNKFQCAKQVKA